MTGTADDGEETESDDDCADRHVETDDEAYDAGWRGEQSSLNADDGSKPTGKVEMSDVARSACPRTSGANGTNNGFSFIKTEIGALPCTTLAVPAALTANNDGPAYTGGSVNKHRLADAAGTPSPSGAVVGTPTPWNEAASTHASAVVSRQTPDVTSSPSPADKFCHQLFHPCESVTTGSTDQAFFLPKIC